MSRVYRFQVHNDDDGLWAECIDVDGCHTQADSMKELRKMAKEAIELFLEIEDAKIQLIS